MHQFKVGDRVVLCKNKRAKAALWSNHSLFGTVTRVWVHECLPKVHYISVKRDGNKQSTAWMVTQNVWEPAELYKCNVYADYLEDAGFVEAAEYLRQKFPLSEE